MLAAFGATLHAALFFLDNYAILPTPGVDMRRTQVLFPLHPAFSLTFLHSLDQSSDRVISQPVPLLL